MTNEKRRGRTAGNLRETNIRRIRKMACGTTIEIPGYATVRAYRCPKTGKRMFSVSKTKIVKPRGNMNPLSVELDLLTIEASESAKAGKRGVR